MTTIATIPPGASFATFVRSDQPDDTIGYRFHEHLPLVYGAVSDGPAPGALEQESVFSQRPGVVVYRCGIVEVG